MTFRIFLNVFQLYFYTFRLAKIKRERKVDITTENMAKGAQGYGGGHGGSAVLLHSELNQVGILLEKHKTEIVSGRSQILTRNFKSSPREFEKKMLDLII